MSSANVGVQNNGALLKSHTFSEAAMDSHFAWPYARIVADFLVDHPFAATAPPAKRLRRERTPSPINLVTLVRYSCSDASTSGS